MKKFIYSSGILLTALMLSTSCSDFEEINDNPYAATIDQVQAEYFINNSIVGAQQNPHIAERAFVLYWKTAAHQQQGGGISYGSYDDGWSSDYYGSISGWLNTANTAIQVANEQIALGETRVYTQNLLQVARIWRAYLMSEMSDNFGPIPVNAFQRVNPEFSDVKTVYYFILEELADASAKLDLDVANPEPVIKQDPSYGYDYAKWQRFANSLRLRFAMRLSEVDPEKARTEFEAAASGDLITSLDDAFAVQEVDGWNDLAGVMSRGWNAQYLSPTLFNIYFGLGGIKSEDQLEPKFHDAIKPADWMGVRYEDHFAVNTNNPSAGYWFDGLPHAIDPRAYEAFIIPGDTTNENFFDSGETATTYIEKLMGENEEVVKEINALYTWNPGVNGNWGPKGTRNRVAFHFPGTVPRMSEEFRTSQSKRIFFAPWETYFLLAEGAVRGWASPMGAKEAYEAGITANFAYWDVPLETYLSSEEYNRVGTSVSWDHTIEPADSYAMNYENGYTGTVGVTTISYPDNHLYKDGAVKNDHLTKIITQKFIAQFPWLPLEAWNDHRRLGLPFFENPAVEDPITNLPSLNSSNFMNSELSFFPQRLRYPSSLQNSNATGYQQAVELLGGPDAVLTPLWWAQKQ